MLYSLLHLLTFLFLVLCVFMYIYFPTYNSKNVYAFGSHIGILARVFKVAIEVYVCVSMLRTANGCR